MTIIIETPQPPIRERLVLVREGEPMAPRRDAEPADLERAGYTLRDHGLDTLEAMGRVLAQAERERDEIRRTVEQAWEHITDLPVGVHALDAEVARLVALARHARDEALALREEREEYRRGDEQIRRALAPLLGLGETEESAEVMVTRYVERVTRERDEARAALAKWQGSAEQERARCVAWLRAEAASSDWASCATWGRALSDTADRLERGEHADTPVPAALPRATDEELFAAYQTAYIVSCGVKDPSEDQRSITRVMPAERKGIAAVAARVRREQPAHAELDAAWAAAQVPVRGLTTLADVITTLRERPAVCLVTRAVEANVDIRVCEDDGGGFMVGVHAPGDDEDLERNVPAADVPATLARLLGEVTRGQ